MKRISEIGMLILALCIVGCGKNQKDKGVEIGVALSEQLDVGKYVIFYELREAGFEAIDTFNVKDRKNFELVYEVKESGFYRVGVDRRQFTSLILDGDDTSIKIQFDSQGGIVSGSEKSVLISEVDELNTIFQTRVDGLSRQAMVAQENGDVEALTGLEKNYFELRDKYVVDLKTKISRVSGSLAALYGLKFVNMEKDMDFFDAELKEILKTNPNHFWPKQVQSDFDKVRKLAIGQPAPDFSLPTQDGSQLSLSDLRGNYVLIDFWAAWCRPCRMENPNVVAAYNKYADSNFEILGVSLDRTREAWLKAIEDDGLSWKHVSDLKYFESVAAQLYNINSIPATYLIDPDGKIVAKNLRGASLEAKLEELFGV